MAMVLVPVGLWKIFLNGIYSSSNFILKVYINYIYILYINLYKIICIYIYVYIMYIFYLYININILFRSLGDLGGSIFLMTFKRDVFSALVSEMSDSY